MYEDYSDIELQDFNSDISDEVTLEVFGTANSDSMRFSEVHSDMDLHVYFGTIQMGIM